MVIRRGRTRVAVLSPAPVITEHRNIWGDLDGELTPEFDEPLDDLVPYTS